MTIYIYIFVYNDTNSRLNNHVYKFLGLKLHSIHITYHYHSVGFVYISADFYLFIYIFCKQTEKRDVHFKIFHLGNF